MKNKHGFTLIELMIAISVASLLLWGFGAMISSAIDVYRIGIESSDAVSKSSMLFKRIESTCVEGAEDSNGNGIVPTIIDRMVVNGMIVGIRVKGIDNNIFWYWWNRRDRNFYRSGETGTITQDDDIVIFNSGVDSSVRIENLSFVFYGGNNNITNIVTNMSDIRYVRIRVRVMGNLLNNNKCIDYNFSSGFKVK